MNITIVEIKKSKHKDKDGKEVVVEERIDHPFETHEHELLGSIANRYIKKQGIPAPPPNIIPTLSHERSPAAPTNPDTPLRRVITPVADVDGKKRFVLARW